MRAGSEVIVRLTLRCYASGTRVVCGSCRTSAVHSRLKLLWASARDSLWLVPSLVTVACSSLAMFLLHAERVGWIRFEDARHFLLGGGAEGARALLSSVAGGLMTVTGVAFSVTIVALQLSSTQFAPRVLPNFLADRANQIVLGILIGTFTYSILVLRVVDSAFEAESEFIPRVSIGVGMLLALVSIAALIFFINHAARSIQISVILERASERALGQLDGLFPEKFGKPDEASPEERTPPAHHVCIHATRSGYLQVVDGEALFSLGESAEAVIRMEHPIGAWILEGQPLARAWPAANLDEKMQKRLRKAFVLGSERTFEQDFELTLIEISDVAVKALSPSINDPTTAQQCIDRLSELLLALSKRHDPHYVRTKEGRLHVIIRDLPFERAVQTSFGQIIHFGASNPAIRKRLIERLNALMELVPEHRRAPLAGMRDSLEEKSAAPERLS